MNTSLSLNKPLIELSPDTLLYATGINKSFALHNQGGIELSVLNVALTGKKQQGYALIGIFHDL